MRKRKKQRQFDVHCSEKEEDKELRVLGRDGFESLFLSLSILNNSFTTHTTCLRLSEESKIEETNICQKNQR